MKSSQIVTLILRLCVAALLGWAGSLKLSSSPSEIALFTTLGMEPHGRFLVGVLEIAAGILILVPASFIPGAILTWGLMAGAILAHLTKIGVSGQSGIFFAAAVATLIAASLILYLNRANVQFLNRMFGRSRHD